jgi:hypothetical protein
MRYTSLASLVVSALSFPLFAACSAPPGADSPSRAPSQDAPVAAHGPSEAPSVEAFIPPPIFHNWTPCPATWCPASTDCVTYTCEQPIIHTGGPSFTCVPSYAPAGSFCADDNTCVIRGTCSGGGACTAVEGFGCSRTTLGIADQVTCMCRDKECIDIRGGLGSPGAVVDVPSLPGVCQLTHY